MAKIMSKHKITILCIDVSGTWSNGDTNYLIHVSVLPRLKNCDVLRVISHGVDIIAESTLWRMDLIDKDMCRNIIIEHCHRLMIGGTLHTPVFERIQECFYIENTPVTEVIFVTDNMSNITKKTTSVYPWFKYVPTHWILLSNKPLELSNVCAPHTVEKI